MAFETVNERRNALNLGLFGLMSSLFIPLEPDGSFSDDDGENVLGYYIGLAWTAPIFSPYKNKAVWNRLGFSRDRVYRIVFSDAVKIVIMNAFIDVESVKGNFGNNKDGFVWKRLGKSRDRIYRISTTSAIKWVISVAYIEVE